MELYLEKETHTGTGFSVLDGGSSESRIVDIVSGKKGRTTLRTTSKTLSSDVLARKELAKRLRKKEKEGFVLVVGPGPIPAYPSPCLARWIRVAESLAKHPDVQLHIFDIGVGVRQETLDYADHIQLCLSAKLQEIYLEFNGIHLEWSLPNKKLGGKFHLPSLEFILGGKRWYQFPDFRFARKAFRDVLYSSDMKETMSAKDISIIETARTLEWLDSDVVVMPWDHHEGELMFLNKRDLYRFQLTVDEYVDKAAEAVALPGWQYQFTSPDSGLQHLADGFKKRRAILSEILI
jgi:hypothetical protein